jgi:CRP/FNR family transcriptional regulator, cyclic AMP receptor protein
MSENELVGTLSQVDLFAGLSKRVMSRIAEQGTVSDYAPGGVVVSQGDAVKGFAAFAPRGAEMHVLLTGTADVVVNGQTVRTLGAGEYFGELSLVDEAPRSADIVAGSDGMRSFALSKWAFEDLLEKHPEVAVPMLRVVVARLRDRG